MSKLMIPLSYAALLGGMCTLTGTSTNLVLQGLVKQDAKAAAEGVSVTMFEMTPVGACVAVSCIVYMAFAARCLLPNHRIGDDGTVVSSDEAAAAKMDGFAALAQNPVRKFVVDVRVRAKSSLIGKPLHQTVLASNGNAVLRVNATIVESPSSDHTIAADDIIVIAATSREIVKLRLNRDITLCRQAQISATLKEGRRHRKLFVTPLLCSRICIDLARAVMICPCVSRHDSDVPCVCACV